MRVTAVLLLAALIPQCDAKKPGSYCELDKKCMCNNANCAWDCQGNNCGGSAFICNVKKGTSCDLACSGNSVCAGGHYECSGDGYCSITCTGIESCQGMTKDNNKFNQMAVSNYGIYCDPSTRSCDINCKDNRACYNVPAYCSSSVCSLDCTQSEACRSLSLTCDGGSCAASCSGIQSCMSATFDWSQGSSATLTCSASKSCKQASITCSSTNGCNIACTDTQSCWGMSLSCPGNKKCHLTCSGTESCQGIDHTMVSGNWDVTCSGSNACHPDLIATFITHAPTAVPRTMAPPVTAMPTSVPGTAAPPGSYQCLWRPTLFGINITSSWCTDICNNDLSAVLCTSPIPSLKLCECEQILPQSADRCYNYRECHADHFTCSNQDCVTVCSGMQSCQQASFDCASSNGDCTAVCSGYRSCIDLVPLASRDGKDSKVSKEDNGKGNQDGSDGKGNSDNTLCNTPTESPNYDPQVHCGSGTNVCDIRCTGVEACLGIEHQCDATTCKFLCSETRSCQGAEYKCTGPDCQADCSGFEGCAQSVFDWADAGNTAMLDCSGTQACMGATIECPASGCEVQCSGFESCKGLTLKCPSNLAAGKKCEIVCSGDWACSGVGSENVCGDVSAVCSGYSACDTYLASLTVPVPSPVCNDVWRPTPEGVSMGYDNLICSTVCTKGFVAGVCDPNAVAATVAPDTDAPATSSPSCSNWVLKVGLGSVTFTSDCNTVCNDILQSTLCTQFCVCEDTGSPTTAPQTSTPYTPPPCNDWGFKLGIGPLSITGDCNSICSGILDVAICKQFCECKDKHTYCTCDSGVGIVTDYLNSSTSFGCDVWRSTNGILPDAACNAVCAEFIVNGQYYSAATCHPGSDQLCECYDSATACSANSVCGCQANKPCAFQCDEYKECYNSNMRCANDSCLVSCTGDLSCSLSTIQCTSGSPTCNIRCSGHQACTVPLPLAVAKAAKGKDDSSSSDGSSDNADGNDANNQPTVCSTPTGATNFIADMSCGGATDVCSITCDGALACQGRSVACASNNCALECSSLDSCASMEYRCSGTNCQANCTDFESCSQAVFSWKDAGSPAVLKCTGTHACMGATIECPASGCEVQCSGFESCKDLTLKCPSNLAAGKKCEIVCSGNWACSGVDNGNLCGDVSAVCSGYNACDKDLARRTASGVAATCSQWESTGMWPVPDALCDTICSADPSFLACRGSVCQCKGRYAAPSPPPVVVTCALGWTVTMQGSSVGVTSEWCEAVCPYSLGHAACTGADRFCVCNYNTAAPATNAPAPTCNTWVSTGEDIIHSDTLCATLCLSPLTNSVCDLFTTGISYCMCGDVDPCTGGTWKSIDSSITDAQCATDCTSTATNKKCKASSANQQCKCEVGTAAPATASPSACSTWKPLVSTTFTDCNALCNSPTTDVVCRVGVPNVVQLCTCVDVTPAPVTCMHWGSLTAIAGVTCGVVCNNPLTDDVCYQQTNVMQLCSCQPCNVYVAVPGAPSGTDCAALCSNSTQSQACSTLCECGGVTDVPATPVPTVIATPVPLSGLLQVVMARVLRFMLGALLRLFSIDFFLDVFRRQFGGLVRSAVPHWVCPLSACTGGCPSTQLAKLQRGCRNVFTITTHGEFEVLEAGNDGTVVEMSVDYNSNVDGKAAEADILQSATTGNMSQFSVISAQATNTEVVDTKKSDSGDSLETWAIVLIVCLPILCIIAVVVIVLCRKQKGENYPDAEAKTVSSSPDDVRRTDDASNAPVGHGKEEQADHVV